MTIEIPLRRFTANEYHRMMDAGILHEDDRLELLEGRIVEMAPISPGHAGRVNRLNRLFSRALAERAVVGVQNSVRLGDDSEPQPDLALLAPRSDDYVEALPRPRDVLLLVEVADRSADYDRAVKAPLYARHGIRELWLVDMAAGCIEVCREPSSEGYRHARRCHRGQTLAPLAFPDIELSVDEVLG